MGLIVCPVLFGLLYCRGAPLTYHYGIYRGILPFQGVRTNAFTAPASGSGAAVMRIG
jgi:hypothetical protein